MTTSDVADYALEDAEKRRDEIKLSLEMMIDEREKVLDWITEARESDDHLVLGYASWTAYVSTEFADLLSQLTREDKRELALTLTETGMSTRAIASVVGVSKSSVANDLAGVQSWTPDVPNITGIDGKTYTKPERRQPRRHPLPTRYQNGLYELGKSLERLDRLHEDDRFVGHREDFRSGHINKLLNAKKQIDNLIRDLTGVERPPADWPPR